MDRNQVIGFSLIGLIIIAFSFFNRPTAEELAKKQRVNDSIAAIDQQQAEIVEPKKESISSTTDQFDSLDTLTNLKEELITLQNDKIILNISSHGGRIVHTELKEYKTYGKDKLVLMDRENSSFGLIFKNQGKESSTEGLFFRVVSSTPEEVMLEADLGQGRKIQHQFHLLPGSYQVDFNSKWINCDSQLPERLVWNAILPQQEKGLKAERNATTIYFKLEDEKADYLSETKSEDEQVLDEGKISWVSFKQQFFNQALIPVLGFKKAELKQEYQEDQIGLKTMSANLFLEGSGQYDFQFYLGPNHFQTLNSLDIGLEKVIPLGWGIFGIVNRFLVIPVFNFLDNHIASYGIIILLLTLIVKLALGYFNFKAFLSGAKMRALKPELEQIATRCGDDMQRKNTEQMKLYQEMGVSPFGGCLPMVLQFPILLALFRFLPSSIELRQKSFLWAEDLSSYDSIWDFGYIPVINSIYGDHMALFPLLMTVSTILYTIVNQNYQPQQQQKELKYLPYIMPVVFLAVLNNYSSGLSYYYFLSNVFAIGQTYLFKLFVDDAKLRLQLEANKKNKNSGKGGGGGLQSRMQNWMEKQQNKAQIAAPKKK